MKQRACVQCNTRWTIESSACPFCGGESRPVEVPPSAWDEAVRSASAPLAARATAPEPPAAEPPRPAADPGRWARFRRWLGSRRGTASHRRA